MQQWLYLLSLLGGIGGLLGIDARCRLAFWHDARRTAKTIVCGMLVFVLWDFLGIGLGIFFHGSSPYTLPLRLFPEFPMEELIFLFLLCYVALLLYRGGHKLWPHT